MNKRRLPLWVAALGPFGFMLLVFDAFLGVLMWPLDKGIILAGRYSGRAIRALRRRRRQSARL